MAIIVTKEEDIAAFKDYAPVSKEAEVAQKPASQSEHEAGGGRPKKVHGTKVEDELPPIQTMRGYDQPLAGMPPAKPTERLRASPLAKNLAFQWDIPLEEVAGTGPQGRIVRNDVLNARSALTKKPTTTLERTTPIFEDLPVSSMRRTIAKRLSESAFTAPHFYISMDVDMDEVMRIRRQLKKPPSLSVGVSAFIIKAGALALRKVPQVNSAFMDDPKDGNPRVRRYQTVDIGFAVATGLDAQTPGEDVGLVTPIVRNADQLSLTEIQEQLTHLVDKARQGKLRPEEYEGGTFTVSSLSSFGVSAFTAIINGSQGAILAVGAPRRQLSPADSTNVDDDAQAEAGEKGREWTVMTVTLSCDHRVVDGAIGARWLQSFKHFLEQPTMMLL
jgi:pyruvate dehydrogenase E2 component (dihydrolipoamide acetyltransferase)